MVQSWFLILRTALSLYAVPLAGAIVGWIFGSQLVVWVLEVVGADATVYQAFMVSSPLVYGAKFLSAILLFLIAHRYLN